jgi:hypothetical protein
MNSERKASRNEQLSRAAVAMGAASGMCGLSLLGAYAAGMIWSAAAANVSASDVRSALRPAISAGLYGAIGCGMLSLLLLLALALVERRLFRRIRRRLGFFLIPCFICCGVVVFYFIKIMLQGGGN